MDSYDICLKRVLQNGVDMIIIPLGKVKQIGFVGFIYSLPINISFLIVYKYKKVTLNLSFIIYNINNYEKKYFTIFNIGIIIFLE